MVIVLAIFAAICTYAWTRAWPLLNLPLGGMTVLQFFELVIWMILGMLALAGLIFLIRWWFKNGVLFKPRSWSLAWFLFGILRWVLIAGLFYVLVFMQTTKTGNSIFNDAPWLVTIAFLIGAFGIYEKLTYLRAWWELRRLSPEEIKRVELHFATYERNFDPVAHKIKLLRITDRF